MKFFTILMVALLATGCATTSDIEKSEARINAKLDELTLMSMANRKGVERVAGQQVLQTAVVSGLVIKSQQMDVKLDRMFEKAMVK